jgi:hypothetical protein
MFELVSKIERHLERQGEGHLAVSLSKSEWTVGYSFGKEAEDSDMAGAASYGVGPDLETALRQVVDEIA